MDVGGKKEEGLTWDRGDGDEVMDSGNTQPSGLLFYFFFFPFLLVSFIYLFILKYIY